MWISSMADWQQIMLLGVDAWRQPVLFFVKEYFPVPSSGGNQCKTGMLPFGILANHKIKMCHNSMKKIMIQKITQNNWNFWTVNLIMWAKKLLTSCQIFRYAVPARTVTKKALTTTKYFAEMCTMKPWPSVLWRCWLGGRKGIWPVKNWVVGCWRGYLSGDRCRLAYGPSDATATHRLLLQ